MIKIKIDNFFKELSNTRTNYILLGLSFIFVVDSITFSHYFFEAFSTFIFTVWFHFGLLARRINFEADLKLEKKTAHWLSWLLVFFLILLPVIWTVAILRYSQYFPHRFR